MIIRGKYSLKHKTGFVIMILSGLLSLIMIFLMMYAYACTMDEHYRKFAKCIAKTAAAQMDADKLDGYLLTQNKDDDYNRMLKHLYIIKDNNDVKFLKVIKFTESGAYVIFDTDRANLKGELGDLEEVPAKLLSEVDSTLIAKGLDRWVCTAGEPILNSNGEANALVLVGISLDSVISNLVHFLVIMITGVIITLVIFYNFMLKLINKQIINPLNKLTLATSEFVTDKNCWSLSEIKDSGNLETYIGDEIEKLSVIISTMEKEFVNYVDCLKKVTAEKDRISEVLNLAAAIQSRILPYIFTLFPCAKEFNLYASMKPAKEVGGDFYDTYLIDEAHLGFVIAEAAGKGVPAAIFMLIVKALIKTQSFHCSSPAEILTIINQQICESRKMGVFATAFLGILDLRTGNLTYANAGHKFPLLCNRGKYYQWINTMPGFVLSGMEGIEYKAYQFQMVPGDRLFLYTDGLTDAMNISKVPYGDMRLSALLNSGKTDALSLAELNDYIIEDVKQFTQGIQLTDDIAMLFVEFRDYLSNQE